MIVQIEIKKANGNMYVITRPDRTVYYIDGNVKKNKKLIDFIMSNST
jgi:hypothetical protein